MQQRTLQGMKPWASHECTGNTKKDRKEAYPYLLKKFQENNSLNDPGFSTALPWPQLDNEWLPHYTGNMHLKGQRSHR